MCLKNINIIIHLKNKLYILLTVPMLKCNYIYLFVKQISFYKWTNNYSALNNRYNFSLKLIETNNYDFCKGSC